MDLEGFLRNRFFVLSVVISMILPNYEGMMVTLVQINHLVILELLNSGMIVHYYKE